MLQLLVDGMKDSPDYYLYKRRHVIELALSYHDSPVSDHRSQVRIFAKRDIKRLTGFEKMNVNL